MSESLKIEVYCGIHNVAETNKMVTLVFPKGVSPIVRSHFHKGRLHYELYTNKQVISENLTNGDSSNE